MSADNGRTLDEKTPSVARADRLYGDQERPPELIFSQTGLGGPLVHGLSQKIQRRLQAQGPLPYLLGVLFIVGIAIPLADFTSLKHFRHMPPGGAEAIVLTIAIAGLARSGKRWALIVIAVLSLAYLRRHHVDLPFVAALIFWEAMAAAGHIVNRVGSPAGTTEGAVRDVVSGLALWLGLVILLSAFRVGRAELLVGVLVVFSLVAIAFARREPLVVQALRSARFTAPGERMLYGIIISWFLILFSRTNSVYAYDAIWYIGRGQYVLAPTGSIFDSLGLASPVYYFPKLLELVLLPFYSLGDFSFLQGVMIIWLFLLVALIISIFREIVPDSRLAAAAALLAATLPALGNDPLTIKADLPAAFFLLFAAWQVAHWLERGDSAALPFALTGLALACSVKLISIPFAALLFSGGAVIWFTTKPLVTKSPGIVGAWWITALALAISSALVFRTWWLTGMPTIGPDALFKLWLELGFSLEEPVGTLRWTKPQDWGDVLPILRDMLTRPTELAHIKFSWVGNFWVTLPLVALLAAWLTKDTRGIEWTPVRALWVACTLLGLVLALAWRYHNRGGDGNYYGFALVLAAILGVAAAGSRLLNRQKAMSIFIAGLIATSVFHAWQGFLLAGLARPGTRDWDWRFSESCFDMRQFKRAKLSQHGFTRTAAHLADLPPETRIVSIGKGIWPYWAPGRIEALQHISHARPEVLDSWDSLIAFLEETETEFLLVSRDRRRHVPEWLYPGLMDSMSRNPRLVEVHDDGGWLLNIRNRYLMLSSDRDSEVQDASQAH